MNKEELIASLEECLNRGDISSFKENIKKYLETVNEEYASVVLAFFIANNYTSFNADSMAKLLELIININPNLALINYPENALFKACLIKGSNELFECYLEEALENHLSNSEEDEIEYYKGLLKTAAQFNRLLLDKSEPILKGLHYNSGVPHESYSDTMSIPREDLEVMLNTIENYNAILGRKDIIEVLMGLARMKY